MADLYRRHRPELPRVFMEHWRPVLTALLDGMADYSIEPVVHESAALQNLIAAAERDNVDCLCLLLLAYTPAGELLPPLLRTRMPLLLWSSAWDMTLPYDMTAEHLLRNQAMHGVMDLANALRRKARPFAVLAGHPGQSSLADKLRTALRAGAGARALQTARIARIGAFPGMLDLTFEDAAQKHALGFDIPVLPPERLTAYAAEVTDGELDAEREIIRHEFCLDPGMNDAELTAGLRIGLALRRLVLEEGLDGAGLSFLSLLEAGAESLPFLEAGRLMARGVAYAGEGDVLCAALQAALRRACGESGFTEWFSPDYGRNEILLSHMGECNLALANPGQPVRLRPRKFAWGACRRVPVPVFQMRPGRVTAATISAAPPPLEKSFQLRGVVGELVPAPEHGRLEVPHTRMRLDEPLPVFLENYARAAGPHHAALAYGDQTPVLRQMADYLGLPLNVMPARPVDASETLVQD